MFKIVKIANEGTTNPIVARLGLGITDIVNMSSLPDDKKKDVGAACFEIMQLLLEAEKAARPLTWN